MRPKEKWGKTAIFAEFLSRLGKELTDCSLWEKYLFLCETTGPGCELAEKCANLMFADEKIKLLLKELDEFYAKWKTVTES